MKKPLSVLLALLLCFSCALLAAAEDGAPTAEGVDFPEAAEPAVAPLSADAEIPALDTAVFSFAAGREGDGAVGEIRYAFGQAYGYDSYFTLITGGAGGEFRINFPVGNADDAYRFTVAPYAAYRLTYTYGFWASAEPDAADSATVKWMGAAGQSGEMQVAVAGGSLRRGRLTVTLLRQDAPPHVHDWGEPVYTWNGDNSAVTAKRICRTDAAHMESETVNTSAALVPASCEQAGQRTWTAAFANPAFAAQTKSAPIPATGHDWGEAVYTWNEDNSAVTAVRICKADEAHMETETVTTRVDEIPATVNTEGKITYTAVFAGAAFAAQAKEVPLPAVRRPGDVDGDGTASSADARLALRASVGLEQYETGSAAFLAADVDGSGEIQPDDARLILRASVGLEDLGKLPKAE